MDQTVKQQVQKPKSNRVQQSFIHQDVEEQREPIAQVQLEISEDHTDNIFVYEGDDIEQLARDFCIKHELSMECVEYIVTNIHTQIQNKEPSPRFNTLAESFGQNIPIIQPCQSKQSTQCNSEYDWSSQKRYEHWQQQLAKNTKNTVVWTTNNNTIPEKKKLSDRLYKEGIESQEKKQEIHKQHIKLKTEQELENTTFQPLISPRSRELANKHRQQASNIGALLYQKGIDLNKKKKTDIAKRQDEIRKQSPFQPSRPDTARNSSQIRSTTPIHEKLYKDAKEGQKKKDSFISQEFSKVHTFQPKSKSPIRNFSKQDEQQLVQKLFQESRDRKSKIDAKIRDEQIKNQPTFHPKINKDSNYQKILRKSNYEENQLVQDIQKIHQKLNSRNQEPTTPRQLSTVQQPTQSQFYRITQKIFNLLGGDKNGVLMLGEIDLQKIDGDSLDAISEALYVIEDDNLKADINMFREICIKLGLEQNICKLNI
ncbi:hypothetical protein pb186bvf_007141 [Paramecium bursaria]